MLRSMVEKLKNTLCSVGEMGWLDVVVPWTGAGRSTKTSSAELCRVVFFFETIG